MCTRFYLEPDAGETREIIERVQRSPLYWKYIKSGNAVLTSGEIKPTNVIPVLAPNQRGMMTVYPMQWGFRIPGKMLIVNAKTETAGEMQAFKEAWDKHRCVIPASWYYEWEHLSGDSGQKRIGDKYLFQSRGSPMTWLCGLYRIENGLPVFIIMTREATNELRSIHDRMPLVLPRDRIKDWINPETNPKKLLNCAVTDMVYEKT